MSQLDEQIDAYINVYESTVSFLIENIVDSKNTLQN